MGSDIATSEAPIACTLSIGDYKRRLAEIAVFAREALRSYEKDDLVLHLRYDAAATDRVKQMIRREQECCAFMNFKLQEEGEEILVTISAPEEARAAAETLFEQFITPAEAGAGGPTRIALACSCAAVACAAACVAPLALPAFVLAGTGAALAWLAGAHGWMTGLALLTVAAAWLWIGRETRRSGMRPSPSTLRFMGVATFLLALALVWPFVEPQIARALGSSEKWTPSLPSAYSP
jgi:hypothetical protein